MYPYGTNEFSPLKKSSVEKIGGGRGKIGDNISYTVAIDVRYVPYSYGRVSSADDVSKHYRTVR